VRVLSSPGLWLETEAVDQLRRVAGLPGCVAAVGLPDLHPGPGIPIGAAFAFDEVVRPLLVGSDAGCGVRMVALPKVKARGDALFRRVDAATAGPALPEVDPAALFAAAWSAGPRGLAEVARVPEDLVELSLEEPPADDPEPAPVPDLPLLGASLGSIGGGNHFLELGEVTALTDRARARALGLKRGGFAVLAHSGSRGLGRWLLDSWGDRALYGADREAYLAQLRGAVRYARTNRFLLAWRLLRAVGCARPGRTSGSLDLVHNEVIPADHAGRPVWLHRKGAAPAGEGEATVVLGSRGTPSHVLRGHGSADCLATVAHGAGRRMGRSEAVGKLKGRYTRAAMQRTPGGGRVLCPDAELLYAEHPDAYKPMAPVIEALTAAGAASPVAELSPRLTVKR